MTLAAVASYVGYLIMRPYVLIARVDCGKGRWIELLERNGYCDERGPVSFHFSGMKSGEPPEFAVWACGSRPPIEVVTAEGGDLVALATHSSDELDLVVDFRSGLFWPHGYDRTVDDDVRNMLGRLRRERGDLWLLSTFDHELTKPDL